MIEVKNLVKCYSNNKKAVDGLNFTIEKGQIVGFLGPNGAGKSTTMNIITGYISATDGTVLIDGYDVLKQPEKAKKNIGYLPEIPPLYTDMTVYEYLKFVAKLKGVKKEKINKQIEKAMDSTRINKYEKTLIKFLSKGYRQRVGIASALLGNPEVLILDEPTVGLDPVQIIEIRELIVNLAKTHTVILSSHILQEIEAVCNRVMIINQGKLVFDELKEDINKNIADSQCYVAIIKGSKSDVKKVLDKMSNINRTVFEDSEQGEVKVRIFTENNYDIREDLFSYVVAAGLVLKELYIFKKSLEDIFVDITREDVLAVNVKKETKKPLSSVITVDDETSEDIILNLSKDEESEGEESDEEDLEEDLEDEVNEEEED
ncbi:MAG: ABC transporter ATP-binding protein [Lachnospiraceae bacterium]|nr:ABC transporter ATP-binding protein [Lachnospiraceae bacterium]